MDFLLRRVFLVIFFISNKIAGNEDSTESNDAMKCHLGLNERIPCGAHGTSDAICASRDCCYDPAYNMCYFPDGCNVLTSVVGGGSFYYILPGRDDPRGRMALPSGRGWCSRDLHTTSQELSLEMSLLEQFSIIFMAEHHVDNQFVFPFLLTYRNTSRRFTEVPVKPVLPYHMSNVLNKMLGGVHKFFWQKVQGDRVRIKPLRNNTGSSCTHITLVTCPAAQIEPVTEMTNFSIDLSALKEVSSKIREVYFTKADERPSAIFIGSFGIIILSVLIAVFVLIDIPSYQRNFTYMRKNIRILQSNMRKRRRKGYKPARMSDLNSTHNNHMPKRKSIDVTQTSLCVSDS